MKEMKRWLALFLCFVMLIGVMPVSALAEDTVQETTIATEAAETTAATSEPTETEAPSSEATEPEGTTPPSSEPEGTTAPSSEPTNPSEPEGTTAPSSEPTEPSSEPTDPVVIPVTGITLDVTALEVCVGAEPVTLTATVTPEDATDKTVTWESSDEEVATVDENGTVTFRMIGEADITATAGGFSDTCHVTVFLDEDEITGYANGETTYVLAGSDFQASSHDTGATIVSGLLDKIKVDYPTMNGFLFAGDYDVNYNDSANGKAKLQETVQAVYGTGMDEIYVQGNHDSDSLVGSTLTASGANDAENYGVFVINEKDYMWYNNDEATIKKTAENLEAYLNAKRNADYTKPIFVMSHLPLHYCMRTQVGGGDGKHANYIFDVLNEAGAAGLNIIFMFGHNHSHGWDDPYGGAAIFLKKGDSINIAQNSTTNYNVETLNFTYLNAGYVSYYRNVNSGAETDLSMTVFAITDSNVTVERYTKDGLHDLKSAGVANTHASTGSSVDGSCSSNHGGNETYSPDTSVVTSAYTLTLNTVITPAGEEIENPDSGNTGSGSTNERTYTRVTSTSDLVSGGQYLIIYNGSHFMLPEVVEKSDGSVRKGFNIESTSVCGPDTITGDYTAKEWTLTSSGSGWLLGNGTQYAKLTNTSDYKIAATLENSGDVFTIGGSENAFTFSNGTYVFNYNDRGLINGYASNAATFYIYRMTNEGSSGGTVDTTGGNWVTITEPTQAGTKYVYELDTNGIDTGVEYLIVANSYPKALSAAASSNNAVDIEISGNFAYADSDTYGWTFTRYSNGVYYIRLNNSTYLALSNNALGSSNSTGSSRRWTVSSNNNGSYDIVRSYYNLRWSDSNGVFQASYSNEGPVRLYKYVKTETTTAQTGLYGKISGELIYNVAIGTSAEDALAAVKAGIDILYHNGDANAAQTFPDDGNGMTWTLDPSYNGSTAGEYSVTIAYNGVTLGVAKVVVPSVNITGYSVEPSEGTVNKGASQAAQTGALIYVQLENGKYYTVPVTVGMLTKADGSAVSTGEEGTYENLTLTYNGVKITENFTLNVAAKAGNNYPEYPNEGAVKVSKTGTGIDFQSSGIAQVEISASGVPMRKGADVIVMLDLSSSMTNTVDGKTRLSVLEASLQSLMTQLKANGDDGQPMDIRIAVADFNRYYPDSASPYYINSEDHLKNGSIRTNADGTNKVYTGSNSLNAGAFVSVHDLAVNEFSGLSTKSGTNYDYAFDAVYQLGEAITAQNATDGVERDLFVIFMSDGAPFQFNYFSAQSGTAGATTDARYWNNWLQGTMTDTMFDSNARNDYYNEDGKHWMAEAIKGNPASTYPVIRKNNAADTDGDTWVNVNGLGAKMYSIGFCLAVDKEITVTSMDTVIRNIATSEQYYFRANSAADLNNAFTAIGGDIAYAAYNARYVDQMGDDYNLQLKTSTYTVIEDGAEKEKTLAPVIEVLTYDIYTKAEADAGQIPTGKNIGDRKGTSALKEVVKFSDDGTKAYSNLIDVDKDGTYGVTVNTDGTYTIADADDNILNNGVISATTFWYNTTATGVEIDGVSIPTGKDSANLTTGSTNVLPSETFYWKMGTVQTSELAMRYYVYLTGSMEGTREGGSYPTNEYATLYYDNYLHNHCYKDTVSPVMPWKEANVSYAFYLVDENGNIIVNQTTGQTGTFANKIAVTNPVVYDTILLNNLDSIRSIEVASNERGILPDGYELYDSASVYTITINSNTTGKWEIVKGDDKVASTYVTQYDPNDASANSNVLTNSTVGNDYTHTVVWFAVLWKIQALPDTVVIDYGLPVDISVLRNDMFGENGELAGVGAYSDSLNLDGHDATPAAGFGTDYTGTYGKAKADASTGKVRYTLNTSNGMQMETYEKFAYAVNYTGATNPGYYYDTVTVIPATTIYYEDSFLTFNDLSWTTTGTNAWEGEWTVQATQNRWSQAGTTTAGATQDEDRPGQYALTDANNIYGYDSANLGMSTYSLGSAMKATVDYDHGAQASFTFMGTGFDVISMTDSTTGTIFVKVYDEGGAKVRDLTVDTYYGYNYGLYNVTYTYTEGEWVKTVGTEVTAEGAVASAPQFPDDPADGATVSAIEGTWVLDPNANEHIWQVPVMEVDDLSYGTYTVNIQAVYEPEFDHNSITAETYDFYLDAIRIYDPANDGAEDADDVIEEAYKADHEAWPSYIELRNKLIDNETLGNTATTTKIEGIVFIDGDEEVKDAQITDYISYGPNNEVYLAPGQRVAFILSGGTVGIVDENGNPVMEESDNTKQKQRSIVDSIHIGIKSADGQEGTYTITNIAQASNNESGITAGDYYHEMTNTINTTTDMYYDITGYKGDIIVISNTGNKYGTNGIISLTNIKSTYTEEPNGDTPQVQTLSLRESSTPAYGGNEVSLYMTPAAAALTLRSLNGEIEETEPEETLPEETAPETTVPETTEPEISEPETTVPEETEPETTVPEETEPEEEETEIEKAVKEIVNAVVGIIKNLFGGWFR